jgi:folate-binding protein YgfZ
MSSLHAEDRVTQRAGRAADDFVARLDHLGMLRFRGDDAETFLQGQLTCDVAAARPGAAIHGAYCTAKGRMLATFLLWREGDEFAMALSRDLAALVHKQLSKYVLRSRVKIADASASTVLLGAAGTSLPGPAVALPDGRRLLALSSDAAQVAIQGLQLESPALWRWLDIRRGVPRITTATQDQLVPQMANLELIGGVSFDKGCYTGQEIVARSQHLGKVKRRMFPANVAAEARPGNALYSEDLGPQASGTVVNAEPSPEGGWDLLAVVHAESRERSTVHLEGPEGPVLRFLPLPYAMP